MKYAKVYGKMHERAAVFPGYSIKHYLDDIAALVFDVGPERILDYGSGKGMQYIARRVHEKWGGILPHCYDVGVPELREKPAGWFQGVICTDVMEHIEEGDVDATLDDIFASVDPYNHAFALFGIATAPSKGKRLPDGRDVHVTVKAPGWWQKKLARFERPGLVIQARFNGP